MQKKCRVVLFERSNFKLRCTKKSHLNFYYKDNFCIDFLKYNLLKNIVNKIIFINFKSMYIANKLVENISFDTVL